MNVSFATVDPRSGEALAAMEAYFAELDERFTDGFDPGDTLTADAASFDPPGGAFVVGRRGDEVVACGGVLTLEPGLGEIKRMWVHPATRGHGVGRRLLAHLEAVGRGLGHRVVRLDTNDVLTEAITMYERAGYRPIGRYNDNPYARRWFEKDLG